MISYRNKLFSSHSIYDLQNTSDIFMNAVIENMSWHIDNCPEYKNLMEENGFKVSDITSTDNLWKIPPLPTLFLKGNNWFSMEEKKLMFKATSSGTSGNAKSVMSMDINSGWNALKMVIRTFRYHKIFSAHPCNYLILGFKSNKENQIGASKTAFGMTLATPTIRREYAAEWKDGKPHLDIDELVSKVLDLSESRLPLRFMGFPAYLSFLLEELEKRKIYLKLPARSMVFTAGGWKQFFNQKQSKSELYDKVEERLGIPKENCRDFFGAVEHPVLYCSCKNNHFHVPIYSRVIIRDVKTLEPLDYGVPGLLNLITPLVKSMPHTSVMTDDLAIIHPADSCGCGINSPYIEILGRSGLKDIKTCAANILNV